MMSIVRDEKFASEIGSFYGEYIGTFTSQNKQVRADLFKRNNGLVAHVSFAKGYRSWTVTDPYIGELKRYAEERGFAGRLQLILSGS